MDSLLAKEFTTLQSERKMGETEIVPPACVIFAPMAFRQSIVARISSENVSHETRTGAHPSAAQMRSRCA